ncbi:hypothetical protein [Nostoc sp. PCC 7107]|uniref:hypothetical protein n=1 Tax=Nostoc sp. PCC 7107 TaxID=317936 RepID=UPI00029F2852|nr:hypothetical protein [Nostoc sp. PCC 7107]AFY45460.1 hypothetical protein Nos7107_4942 [Nostoc sp. PCC 7107]
MNYRIEKNNELQPSSYFNFNTVSTLDSVKISVHPTIQQLFALGYEVGDRVVGRNLCVHKDKRRNKDWSGTLTKNNIVIQEYVWKFHKIVLNDEIHEDGLSWLEEQNHGERQIYFNVNGGRTTNEVGGWRSLFFEEDDGTFQEQQAKIDAIPIPPSVQVRTRKSKHTYFSVWADETENIEDWSANQELIAYYMGSDPSLKDAPRPMRLAGFDHVKVVNGEVEYVPCVLEVCALNRFYSVADVLEAFESYAKNNGIKPFSKERFKGYQYVNSKLRQKETGHIYDHPSFDKGFFRICEDSEVTNHLARCKRWAGLCEKRYKGEDCADPETAWTEEVNRVKEKVKAEYGEKLIPAKTDNCTPVLLSLAGKYLEGFNYNGRAEYATAKCPVHGGTSIDSLHIHRTSGNFVCHSGCDKHEIEKKIRDLAKDSGDERWNWQFWNGQESIISERNDFEPINLNKLTIRPGWHHITDCSIKKPWGLIYDSRILEKIPSEAILILKAPMGAGKTELVNVLINEIYRNSRVVSITPTIALNEVLGNRLKIETRNEMESLGVNPAFSSRIGVVCPSLYKLLGRSYNGHSIALFDENRQSSQFLFQSKECDTNYSPRSQSIRALNEVCKNSDIIVVSDAYITDVEVDYVTNLRPDLPVYVLEIPTYAREREIWEITDEAKIYELIDQLLSEGQSLIIPCDSQKTGEALDEVYNTKSIEERYREKGFKAFRLDCETKEGREQKLFLNNPTEYVKAHPEIRLFIYSPTLGSGASIEDGHFDAMVAINTHLPSTDFMQQTGRYRPAIPLYYWASGDKPNKNNWSKSFYPSSHKKAFFDSVDRLKEMLAKKMLEIALAETPGNDLISATDKLSQMAREGMEGQSPGLDLICNQRARHNYLSCKRRDKLRQQFLSDGFSVKSLDAEDEIIDDTPKELNKNAKDLIMQRRAVAVIKAPLISEAEGKKLLNKRVLKPEERAKAEKYKFNKMLPGFLDSLTEGDAIEFYYKNLKDRGQWVSSVFSRWRWENKELLKAKDLKNLEFLLQCFKDSGVDSPGDLDKLRSPYFKFIEEIGFFNEFALGSQFTLGKVIQWAFKLKSEADIEELLSYSGLKDKDATKAQRDAIAKKFIKPLPARYRRELEKYLGIILSSHPKTIKYLTRSVGNVLRRFGFDLSRGERAGGNEQLRIYKVMERDNVLQKKLQNPPRNHHF